MDLFIRIKLDEKIKTNSRLKSKKIEDKNQFKNKTKVYKKENKVIKKYKIFKMNRGLEKNAVLQDDDIKVAFSSKSSQTSFFKTKNELAARYAPWQ